MLSERCNLPRCALVLAAVSLLCASLLSAEGTEKRLVLAEHLGQEWTNELVTFPFEASKGACVVESVHATGPLGRSGQSSLVLRPGRTRVLTRGRASRCWWTSWRLMVRLPTRYPMERDPRHRPRRPRRPRTWP